MAKFVLLYTGGSEPTTEAEGAAVEVAHLLVAFHQGLPLRVSLLVGAGRDQPQILHRGAGEEVVEIEEERAALSPEEVAEVTIAVDARAFEIGEFLECGRAGVEDAPGDVRIARAQ